MLKPFAAIAGVLLLAACTSTAAPPPPPVPEPPPPVMLQPPPPLTYQPVPRVMPPHRYAKKRVVRHKTKVQAVKPVRYKKRYNLYH
jgi:hypothetical protein